MTFPKTFSTVFQKTGAVFERRKRMNKPNEPAENIGRLDEYIGLKEAGMDIKIESVSFDGGSMDFFRFGTGEKALVIVPGLSVQSVMNSAKAIADEYAVMKDDFTVFVFDRKKDVPPQYSVREMAEDTVSAIRSLGLRDVCLFGASQGGMIVLEIAAKYPDLVKKAAVASTPVSVSEEHFGAIEDWIGKAEKCDGAGLYLSFGRSVYPAEVYEKYKPALLMAGNGITDYEFRRFITLARAAEDFDFTPRAKDIRCPLFVAASTDDGIFGDVIIKQFKEVFGDLSGFEYRLYEGYGHAVYDTAPDFRDRLYGFFIR